MFKQTQVRVPWTVVANQPHEVFLSERCIGFLIEFFQAPEDAGLEVFVLLSRDREGVAAVQSDDPNPPVQLSPLKYTCRLLNNGDTVETEPNEIQGGIVKLWIWSENDSVGIERKSAVAITLFERE